MKEPSSVLLISVLFAGMIIGCFLLMLYAVTLGVWDRGGLEKLSKDHGSSLAALATFATIVAAVWLHYKNVCSERDREDRSRLRKADAARSRMSLALSDMIDYTRACYPRITHEIPFKDIPPLPQNALNLLSEMIEHVDDQSSKTLAILVAQYQRFDARFRSKREKFSNDLSREILVKTLVELYLHTDSLFLYAGRHEGVAIPIPKTRDEMIRAYLELVEHDHEIKNYRVDFQLIENSY